MIFLASIVFISFLILIALMVLKCRALNLGLFFIAPDKLKTCDYYLERQFLSISEKIQKIRKFFRPFALRDGILFRGIIVFCDILKRFLAKILIRAGKFVEKTTVKRKGESVSTYLRDISDYKENGE